MVNKMIMAVVPRDRVERVMENLVAAGYTATLSDSRSGILRQAQNSLFIAVQATHLEQALAIIREGCRANNAPEPARPAQQAGSAIFVWDLNHFEVV